MAHPGQVPVSRVGEARQGYRKLQTIDRVPEAVVDQAFQLARTRTLAPVDQLGPALLLGGTDPIVVQQARKMAGKGAADLFPGDEAVPVEVQPVHEVQVPQVDTQPQLSRISLDPDVGVADSGGVGVGRRGGHEGNGGCEAQPASPSNSGEWRVESGE